MHGDDATCWRVVRGSRCRTALSFSRVSGKGRRHVYGNLVMEAEIRDACVVSVHPSHSPREYRRDISRTGSLVVFCRDAQGLQCP